MKKHNFRTVLVAGALLATVGAGAAHASVSIQLNGQPLATSTPPIQLNGTTLLPMRDVFEALGAQVSWNGATQSISALSGNTNIQLGINNSTAIVNGQQTTLAQPPILVNGSAFVPLRFVAEATGAQVDWNGPLQLVSIRQNQSNNPTVIAQAPYQAPPSQFDNGNLPYQAPPNSNWNTNNPPYQAPPSRPNWNGGNRPPYQAPPVNTNTNIGGAGTQIAGFREISIPSDVVVPVRLDSALSSANTNAGATFTATVVSNRLGDSEFPAGTKVEGLVVESRRAANNQPGVLDLDFQNAVLPDGTRIPIRGRLASLDTKSVSQQDGRLVASGPKKNDSLKVIGIGAGAGYVLGRLLKTNSLVSTILGAGGGYLYSRSRNKKAEEATLAQDTTLGVHLLDPVSYNDTNNYWRFRDSFMRSNNNRYDSSDYGFDDRIAARPDENYDGYDNSDRSPDPAIRDDAYNDDVNQNDDLAPVRGHRNDDYAPRAVPISIPSGAVIPVTIDQEISSATARVGQQVTATVASQRLGDSEFPAGTKILGTVAEAHPRDGDNPGVLDFQWNAALTPDGMRVPLQGELINLDDKSVSTQDGRIVAKAGSKNDRLKVIGIGAGAGYVVGRLLKKDGLLSAIIGAAGGFIYDQTKNKKAAEAVLPAGAKLGVRLDNGISYNDNTYYASRAKYLRLN